MIHTRAINYYQGKDTDVRIVFIKGLYSSDMLFQQSLNCFKDLSCITVDLHAYVDQTNVDLNSIVDRICMDLDHFKVSNAIFVSIGIGGIVALKIAMKKSDLILGNIMLGICNKSVDEALRLVQIDILNFAKNKGFDSDSCSLIVQTLVGCKSDCETIEKEVKLICSNNKFSSLLELVKLQQQQHLTREEIKSNKIPNFIITSDSDPWSSPTDVHNFSREIGTNRGFMNIKKIANNTLALINNEYNIVLKIIVKELLDVEQSVKEKVLSESSK